VPTKTRCELLENLMDEYDLIDVMDGEETHTYTRNGETSGSLIDFFITKALMANRSETSTDLATTSDHAVVCAQLRCNEGEGANVSRKITGWDIDGLKSKEEEENYKKAQKEWKDKSSKRPVLNEKSSEDELQMEAEWIQRNFVNHLDRCCKKIKVCARSKRWWTAEIVENRKILGSIKRARKKGEESQLKVKKQCSILRRMI